MFTFGHIGIPVVDLEESKKFYTEILECKIVKEYDYPEMTLVFLDGGGTYIELIYKKNQERVKSENPSPIDHLAFKVPNLDSLIKKLNQNNIEILREPKIVGKARILFFRGPNNEKFEFVERIG
ncbi:VOC family protein [Paramaledivibacter caminithermalis]|jgi:lactoylglutathione lyase|uniref:Glyoxalase/Bleomycin resistance protein/Dioxygenase superfamily protein n=1 Tax=Paramaledivibacter caminithermalis (strain DSM 15212 / CIP 107654 / DViRD3) TaxID=1121301 RepID=A0A1M6MGW7_PARC5|nr:VOC family protein [Paramaledivibacter caminithermalis]SHJ82739.1 Glyoxalase/Bleomycin resistance protein/Dioxygenase superfamily protein [Paramaledivibacter caminithermalis DSM 15212]